MFKSYRAAGITAFTVAALSAGGAIAQDTHYWTQQYGTQGELLLGTVVGSLKDLSAVYYNPGALALQENPSLVLGANAFEYQSIALENEQGERSPLSTRSFGPAPTLFAGILPPKWIEGEIGYSALTRQNFDFRMHATGSGFVTNERDSLVGVGGELLIDQNLSDIWFGLTWSRAWGRTGIGVTLFGAYHGQRTRYQMLLQGLRPDTTGASATYVNEIDYWHVRLVGKFGMAWDYDPLTFGFAVTAPGIGLFGEGSSVFDYFVSGVDHDDDGIPDTELIANRTKNVPADYRSPASIAGGASYRYKDTSFHFSAEWFSPVDEYEVMPSVYFDSPTTGQTYGARATSELESVFNWGLGVERHVKDWFNVYGSFITDRSAYVEDTETNVSVASWDLHHVMGGSSFTFLGADVTLGIGYSWGSDRAPAMPVVATRDGEVRFPLDDVDTTLKYRRWKFIVGFAFGGAP